MIEYFNPSSVKAYNKVANMYQKNPEKCIEKMKRLCTKGNKHAATFLKTMLINQSNSITDVQTKMNYIANSNYYLRLAADFGCVDSQYQIAKKYEIGDGIEKNPVLSFKYFLMAARNGDAIAQTNVGRCYALGIGVGQNAKEAKYWEMMAANQGETIAMTNIALGYENGKGVPQNSRLAREWYEKAYFSAKRKVDTKGAGEREYYEKNELKSMELAVEGIKRIDLQILCEEYREASDETVKNSLFEKIYNYANGGEWRAQFEMGLIYNDAADYARAQEWFKRAADNGSSGAMAFIGYYYYEGLGVISDYKIAFEWFSRAVEYAANSRAMYMLGKMYEYGQYVQQDINIALSWYRKASIQGYSKADVRVKAINARMQYSTI